MKQSLGMIFGAQYYRPPFPDKSVWLRDFDNMKQLGFETVKLWAVWNDIEKAPGCFDFKVLDDLMTMASAHEMRVVINLIPEGAPYWTLQDHQDALYQTADGHRVTYGGPANLPTAGWPGLCLDKPEVAVLVQRFITRTARHLSRHPALLAIDVWNEPHLEPMFDYRSDMLCYCGHSIKRFRDWLIEKYQTIDAINMAWLRRYAAWEEVLPPPRIGTWTDMMDWRLFWLDNLRRWLRLRVEAARLGAPNTLMQTHVAYSGYVGTRGNGGLANELGDEFLLAREVDVFGLTCFPKWLMREDPLFNHLLNNEIIAAAADEKPFYQVELQGGGGKAGLLGGEVPTASDIRLWNYLTIAAGGKGVTYWQYAPEPSGEESPGFGLTGFQGENTERSKAAGLCARELNHPLLAAAIRVRPMNAIYLSRTNSVWFYAAQRQERQYAQAIHGFYKMAYESGVPIGFAHQDRVHHLWDDGIRALLLPAPLVLSREETAALRRFVSQGGTLVSEPFPGLYNEQGVLDQTSYALLTLFGLRHVEVQALPENQGIAVINGDQRKLSGENYRQAVQAAARVEILDTFEGGAPAITVYLIGKGKSVWLGTMVSALYAQRRHTGTLKTIMQFLHPQGYAAFKSLQYTSGNSAVDAKAIVRLLETEQAWILVMVNPTLDLADVLIQFFEGKASEMQHEYQLQPMECRWSIVERLG